MKTDIFQSCDHCWDFQICWHIECSTLAASSFRIWNRSARIPSFPLALFVVILPKAYLTSHFMMSGSRWVITPGDNHHGYLGHKGIFLNSSSVYSCHLFLISSASVRSIQFPSIIVPLISLVLLKRSPIFSILLFPLFLCTVHLKRLSCLPLLFFVTLFNDYIFPSLLCL